MLSRYDATQGARVDCEYARKYDTTQNAFTDCEFVRTYDATLGAWVDKLDFHKFTLVHTDGDVGATLTPVDGGFVYERQGVPMDTRAFILKSSFDIHEGDVVTFTYEYRQTAHGNLCIGEIEKTSTSTSNSIIASAKIYISGDSGSKEKTYTVNSYAIASGKNRLAFSYYHNESNGNEWIKISNVKVNGKDCTFEI